MSSWLRLSWGKSQRRQEQQLDRELHFHIEERVADLMTSGISESEARRLVRLEFGTMDQVKDDCRDARPWAWLEQAIQDLGYSVRMMGKKPAFTFAVVELLGLGIGANAAVFSIVDAVLLRTAPYPTPNTLVRIEESSTSRKLSGVPAIHYQHWAERKDVLKVVAPYLKDTVTLTGDGEPEQVAGVRSQRLFRTLGVSARLGRGLTDADEKEGATNAVVLSHRLWQRRYQSDPGVLGRAITISGERHEVVGVMPPDFEFHFSDAELWTPLRWGPSTPWVQVAARLQDQVPISQAERALEILARQIEQEKPKDYSGLKITVKPWQESLDSKYKSTVAFVLVSAALIMLIVCANAGSLLLSRAIQRQKEICIRASLGAGRWRIVRQLTCESLVLAFLGCVLGIGVALVTIEVLTKQLASLPIVLPHLQRIHLDGRVLSFSLLLSLATTILCSLAPVLMAVRSDLQSPLRGGPTAAAPRGTSRMFSTLIALEAGFAFLLLAGAGLMIRSLNHLQQVDYGFRPDHVLTLRIPVGTLTQPRPTGKYDTRPRQMAYYREILERVRTVPGVKASAIVNNLPLSGITSSLSLKLPSLDGKSEPTSARTISPQYFAAMGIPLIAGRDFTDGDQGGARAVSIINEYLARRLFPNGNAIGERLPNESGEPGATIVGVVKDAVQSNYESPAAPEIYIPYQQFMFATFMSTLVVRTESDPVLFASTLRDKVWEIDRDQPIVRVETMNEVLSNSIWRPRFSAWIFSVLGVVSLLLAGAGIYAIVANMSAMREHELGVRAALGATSWNILSEVLLGGLAPLALGLGLSAIVALALSRYLTSLLYGVSGGDPLTYFGAAALLFGIGVTASAPPARQAAKRDPLRTLRAE